MSLGYEFNKQRTRGEKQMNEQPFQGRDIVISKFLDHCHQKS
jgi:hypothetical protein